ncbi:hypothetical protein SCUCBS95973_002609 [Sporothrix curviconia]|uniref:Acid phosphatase-like protein n=1 Tax=Sporothrix curviconia TaxID=1260050 RepID=A0ABP0B974_9PEZI
MRTGGIVVLVIVLLLLAAGVGWIVFARLRAQRLGLPPPSWTSFIPFRGSSRSSYGVQPAPSGIGGWFQEHFRRLRGGGGRNNRTAAGAYEGAGTSSRGAARQGFGPLDPDDAWDARVGAEADAYYYNEEQELGLHTNQHANNNSSRLDIGGGASVSNTAYLGSGGGLAGSSYDMNVPTATIGDDGFEERGRTRGRSPGTSAPNPFDDDAADPSNMSLRGVSPRPMGDGAAGSGGLGQGGQPDSPTERRSMFRESV